MNALASWLKEAAYPGCALPRFVLAALVLALLLTLMLLRIAHRSRLLADAIAVAAAFIDGGDN